MVVIPTRRKFTVDEYHRMAGAGILHEDDRVELINGEIIQMSPIGRRHAACVNRLNEVLTRNFSDVSLIAVQNPIVLSPLDEPQPDLALLRRRPDYYAMTLPGPEDVYLLIEVADASLSYDRDVKLPLYARHGIAEVWLVDLTGDQALVCSQPEAAGYQLVAVAARGDVLAPRAFPDRALRVETLRGL